MSSILTRGRLTPAPSIATFELRKMSASPFPQDDDLWCLEHYLAAVDVAPRDDAVVALPAFAPLPPSLPSLASAEWAPRPLAGLFHTLR